MNDCRGGIIAVREGYTSKDMSMGKIPGEKINWRLKKRPKKKGLKMRENLLVLEISTDTAFTRLGEKGKKVNDIIEFFFCPFSFSFYVP